MRKFNKLLEATLLDFTDQHSGVEALAHSLCNQMEKIHGGKWRIHIDHETHFVMVRMSNDKGPIEATALRRAI